MPNLLQFDPGQFVGFFVIFTRLGGLMLIAPTLGDNNIPPQIKIVLTFLLSLVFFPVVAAPDLGPNPDLGQAGLMIISEFAVGLLMGFAVRLMFTAVSLAGEVAGFQMGIGIANIFDPGSETQVSLIGQINMIFALLLFVVMDGHHIMIKALAGSYDVLPPGAMVLKAEGMQFFVGLVGNLFLLGLQIGAPLIVALLAANLGMGLMARSVPQLNVIIVGFPFTIGLGLLLMIAGFPFYIQALIALNERVEMLLMSVIKVLS